MEREQVMFNSKSLLMACAASGVFAAIGMGGGMAAANTITDNFNSDGTGTFAGSSSPTNDPYFSGNTTVSSSGLSIVNVSAGNNVLQITGAGIVNTDTAPGNAPWEPSANAPVTVTGDVSFATLNSQFHIDTRSTGQPENLFFNSPDYGNINGLRFGIQANGAHGSTSQSGSFIFIDNYGGTGTGTTTDATATYTNFNIAAGDNVQFTVVDSGPTVSLSVTDSSQTNDTASITATTTYTPPNNAYLVSFEGTGTFKYNLDNVTITNSAAIPEPATLGLMAVVGAGLLVGKRKRA